MIKRPTVLQDLTEYKSDNSKPHAKYGLPEDVSFVRFVLNLIKDQAQPLNINTIKTQKKRNSI